MIISIYVSDGFYEINTYFHYRVTATTYVIRIGEIDEIILISSIPFKKKTKKNTIYLAVRSPIHPHWPVPQALMFADHGQYLSRLYDFDDLSWLDTPYNLVCVGAVVTDWREAWQVGSWTNGKKPDKVN